MSMRIHKFLSVAGVTSRRRGEELVKEGRVTVNGRPATIGQVIDEDQDVVAVNGKNIKAQATHVSYIFNKPRFVVSTLSDPQGRKSIKDFLPGDTHIYPVGRLDYESEGLMLVTSDGDLAYRLTHPKFEVPKTYRVQVKGNLTKANIAKLENGVVIDGKRTAKAEINNVEADETRTWFEITIHEGRNRQIRKMCAAVRLPVTRLIRIKLGSYELADLKPGMYKELVLSLPKD